MSKKLLIIAGGAVAALVAFGAIFAHIASEPFDDEAKLKLACRWLDEGRWDLAKQTADDLEQVIDTATNARWQYVSGTAKLIKIQDELDSAENRRTLLQATKELETARQLGFPAGLTGKGYYYLGFSHFHTYQWDAAIEMLDRSYQDYPDCRSLALWMIVQAHMRKTKADVAAAQSVLERWDRIPGKSASESARVTLCKAQLSFHDRQYQQCIQQLDGVDRSLPEWSEAQNWRSRCYIELADRETDPDVRKKLLTAAHDLLKRQIFTAETTAPMRRQASYLFGHVLRLQDRKLDATGAFSVVRQQNPNSAEAIVASLEEAEVLLELQEYAELLTTTRHLLRGVQDISLFNDYWLSQDELRTRLIAIGDKLRLLSEFDRVLQLAKQLTLVFPPAYSLRLQASTYVDWAERAAKESSSRDRVSLEPPSANPLAGEAISTTSTHTPRELYLKAGETLERLAMLELMSPDYVNLLWRSAECYQLANQIDAANRMLETYLKFETRTRQPRALMTIGKNYIAAGRWQDSIEPLQRCLEYYAKNPVCYEVRLLLSRAHTELLDLDRAIELLSENLWDYDLSPESPVWRDSSIELGSLVFQRGSMLLDQLKTNPPKDWSEYSTSLEKSHADLLRGIEQLGEAVERYPNDSRYFQTRYQLAQSYRLAAEIPKMFLSNDTNMADADRRQQSQHWRRLMGESVDQFRSLLGSIQKSSDTDELTPAILRNCYFGEADALSSLGRYQEAIDAYRNAASFYVNQPEALEALVEIVACQKKLGKDQEAKKVLRQAQQVLQRIPASQDGRFVSATRGNRAEWQQKLDWMSQQYQ